MSQIKLDAQTREGAGKGVARQLRMKGQIPGVLYGRDSSPQLFSIAEKHLSAVLREHGLNFVIELSLGDKTYTCMVADYQRDVFQRKLVHVDFKLINLKDKVTVKVPITMTGDGDVRARGGIAQLYLQTLAIRIFPTDIPKDFKIDVSNMQPGETLKLENIDLPEDFERLDPLSTTVVNILAPRAMAAARTKE